MNQPTISWLLVSTGFKEQTIGTPLGDEDLQNSSELWSISTE